MQHQQHPYRLRGYRGGPVDLAGKPERTAAQGCGIQIQQVQITQACPVDCYASWLLALVALDSRETDCTI